MMQAPRAVVMVRPHFFTPNQQTAADNVFQSQSNMSLRETNQAALTEVNNLINALQDEGVQTIVFDDEGIETPDSVFPNNWFSTHECGALITYPMYCENRRLEVNPNIINALSEQFQVKSVIDYSREVEKGRFLEGTGAMVLDHDNKIAYAVKSNRMDASLMEDVCGELGYRSCVFDACDDDGVAVYHTNVMMCVTEHFVMIGLEMINNLAQRQTVIDTIESTGKRIIELTTEQVKHFAGNALEIYSPLGNVLAMSGSAKAVLSAAQKVAIEKHLKILAVDIPTIELAGGSVRCMLAGIHLTAK